MPGMAEHSAVAYPAHIDLTTREFLRPSRLARHIRKWKKLSRRACKYSVCPVHFLSVTKKKLLTSNKTTKITIRCIKLIISFVLGFILLNLVFIINNYIYLSIS